MPALGMGAYGGITPIAPLTRWILNTDPGNVLGVTYAWEDAETWDDTKVWKD
jgi:hypothetical protein